MSRKNRVHKKQKREIDAQSPASSAFNIPRNWVIGIILAVTFFAFSNSLFNGFAYDDTTQILTNEFIRDWKNIPTAMVTEAWFWRTQQDQDPNKQDKPSTAYYRPVFTIYLMVGWYMFENSPFGWHLASLALHLLAVFLVFLLLEKLTRSLKLSAIATVLFAVHPLRSESVAWISGLTDLSLALFIVPSFYFYIRYRESGRAKDFAWAIVLFLLGVFAKEPAVALPVFIFAYELLIANREKGFRERLKPAIVFGSIFMAVSIFYFAMRYYALGFILSDPNFVNHSNQEVALTIPLVIWKYIGLLFAGFVALPIDILNEVGIRMEPVNFSIFHSTPLVTSLLSIRFILPLLGLVALSAVLWPLRKSTISRFAILWFFIHLLPVLNLNAFSQDFLVQERYVYIPSIGFSLLLAQAIVRLTKERRVAVGNRRVVEVGLLVLIVIFLSGKSFAQNRMWKDDLTLWMRGTEAAYDQTMPYYIMGHKYISQRRFDKAIEQFEKYMQLDRKNVLVLNNLAASHIYMYELEMRTNPNAADNSRLERAISLCEEGLKIQRFSSLYDTLGMAYTFKKEYWMAQARFDQGLALEPDNAMIIYHKGATYLKEARVDDALRYLEPARQISPDLPDTYESLGYAYMVKGRAQEAINSFTEFLRLQPYSFNRDKISQYIKDLNAQLQSAQPKG